MGGARTIPHEARSEEDHRYRGPDSLTVKGDADPARGRKSVDPSQNEPEKRTGVESG